MTSAEVIPPLTEKRSFIRISNENRWLIPAVMVVIAFIARLPYLGIIGSPTDASYNNAWGEAVYYHNFGFYRLTESNHPPLYPVMNSLVRAFNEIPVINRLLAETGVTLDLRLKIPAVLADFFMIVIAARWLRNEQVLRWAIPLFLALHPGLIANSSFWSQSDPVFTLFLVVALLLLRGDKPRVAWIFYALALLTKFQAVVMLPLMVILTYRRYPLKQALIAAGIGTFLFVITLLPFAMVSGLNWAIRPYFGATLDLFPYTTLNAYNIWMVIEPGYWDGGLGATGPDDIATSWIQPLTFRQLGFLMLGSYTLLICVIMWRQAHKPREFIWATALYFGFFMLPTQMHERYLYGGVVMSIFAIAQDRRMILVALFTVWTFTFNLITSLSAPYYWFGNGLRWYIGNNPAQIALVNLLLLINVTLLAIFTRVPRILMISNRVALAGVCLFIVAAVPPIPRIPQDTQLFYNVTVGQGADLIGYRILNQGPTVRELLLYWRADQPIYASYLAIIDAQRDGERVAYAKGSAQDEMSGSWRWVRGQVTGNVYILEFPDGQVPDTFHVSIIESTTGEPIPIYDNGSPGSTEPLVILNPG